MKLQTIFLAWFVAATFGSLLGTLLAEKREQIKKMLPMIMIAGIGVIVVMLLYTSISHGANNSVEELNQKMTELQNQSPK